MPGVYTDLADLLALKRTAEALSGRGRRSRSPHPGGLDSLQRGRGLTFEELRHYRAGDDIRLLDWKATRRTGHPLVRIFTEERERPVWLLLDQRAGMFFGSRTCMKSVFAAELAALLAWRAHLNRDRVGLLLCDDQGIAPLAPQRTQRQLIRLLQSIAACNQRLDVGCTGAPEQLDLMLREANNLIAHDAQVVLISDLAGWNNQSERLLAGLSRHNEVVVAQVFDPLEHALPEGGYLSFGDGRDSLLLDTGNRTLRQRYQDLQGSTVDQIRQCLVRYGVRWQSLDAQKALVEQLMMPDTRRTPRGGAE